jgi:hypothetical protein
MTKKLTSTTCSTQKTKPKVCRIHVNQFALRKNIKEETDNPAITVKHGDSNTYGHEVQILDADGNVIAKVVQPLNKKLSCGARVWIETYNRVKVVGRKPHQAKIAYIVELNQ